MYILRRERERDCPEIKSVHTKQKLIDPVYNFAIYLEAKFESDILLEKRWDYKMNIYFKEN